MVTCDPYQTYKIPLKTDGQSIIEHNLVTIYLNLEWPDNADENPNLLLHIVDKKSSPKPCKNEASMSYFQQNQSSLLVNSIHHHQQQNFGSTYQQQYYHHSSVINNDQPTTTTTITTGDHNDVSSTTTTTVVFSASQPPPPPPPPSSSSSQTPIQQIKNEVKTQLSPIYRRQANSTSPPVVCSSTNPPYLSTQHVIQTPSSNLDTQSNLHTSPTLKSISPTSSTHLTTKPPMAHVIDLQPTPVYPLSTSSTSPTFKAFVCTCLKPHLVHEHNCPTLTLVKQQSNTTLTSQTIVCRPPINRTIAQRAAVASQNRTNRSISMTTPAKEQGQTSLPFAISNIKTADSLPHITTIISQQQQQQQINNPGPMKKTLVRQRSANTLNARQRKKRLIKQISLPNGTNQEQTSFYNQINLNDVKSQPLITMIKEEHLTSPNPTIKLVSPFAIQTTVSNSDIDQTIDDVINGKVDIPINHHSPPPPPPPAPTPPTKLQPPRQPSSQLVWVQNGTVTTKTWLSPLYQKQQQQQQQQQHQQSVYDPTGSTLTHQDVVNIAQQVVFPTNTESNQGNVVLPPVVAAPNLSNSKKRNRSKATTNPPLKRIRNRKPAPNRSSIQLNSSSSSSQIETQGRVNVTSPITPIHNLINKPIAWPNLPTPSSGSTTTTNTPILNSHPPLPSFDKNDSWQSQCVENVDSMLDEFQLVSIDQQRNYSTNHFDFDLSIDGFPSKSNERFSSSTPPPLLTIDNARYSMTNIDKSSHSSSSSLNNSRLVTGDVDVYDHFLNPYSSSMWQENQVTSSVSTPPDFQLHHFSLPPSIHPSSSSQQQTQGTQQYYSSSQTTDEHFDSFNPQSQVRLLFDVQS